MIDIDFYDLAWSTYPGGEAYVHITKNLQKGAPRAQKLYRSTETSMRPTLYAHITSADVLMRFVMVVDALKQEKEDLSDWNLHIPYIPYGRQDRLTLKGSSFSLAAFGSLINPLLHQFGRVYTNDPHSEETIESVADLFAIDFSTEMVKSMVPEDAKPLIIAPDEGARYRAEAVAESLGVVALVLDKHRDPETGEVVGIEVPIATNVRVSPTGTIESDTHYAPLDATIAIVVDDICDGGATFLEVAQLRDQFLRESVPLHLAVTHGIMSKGFSDLLSAYDSIACQVPFGSAVAEAIVEQNVRYTTVQTDPCDYTLFTRTESNSDV